MFLALTLAAGCTSAGGKVMAETKVPTKENPNAVLVPYTPPDIEEISGTEDDADAAAPAAPEVKQ